MDMDFSIFLSTVSNISSRIRTYGRLELFVIDNEFETCSTNRPLSYQLLLRNFKRKVFSFLEP